MHGNHIMFYFHENYFNQSCKFSIDLSPYKILSFTLNYVICHLTSTHGCHDGIADDKEWGRGKKKQPTQVETYPWALCSYNFKTISQIMSIIVMSAASATNKCLESTTLIMNKQ
jgi:hypothetical protein